MYTSDSSDNEPSPCKNRRTDTNYNFDTCQMSVCASKLLNYSILIVEKFQIDNSQNILKTIKNLYVDQIMCDVYLSVGSKVHAAHKLILSASSDVFQVFILCSNISSYVIYLTKDIGVLGILSSL